jgi:Flp pilus assembly pilin Flp
MKHKFARGVRAFASDQAGVAAIEFSFLAWPFFGVVLMILNSFVVQYFRNSLDGAVSNLASDLRSGSFILKDATMVASSVRGGGVVVSVSALRARLQTYLPVGMDVNKVLIESFARTNCSTNGGCWDDAYSDLTHGVRKSPTFNVNSTLSNLQISGSSSGSPAVQFGVAGASQYLVVYYPMSPFSTIFTGNGMIVQPPTAVVGGKRVYGLVSAAMWINDPSVGVF